MKTQQKYLAAAVAAVVATGGMLVPHYAMAEKAVIEEVIVSARKRDESLQKVPLPISAFTARDIESAGMTDVRDVAAQTPGLNFSSEFGRTFSRPSIRGLTNTSLTIEQPVSVFVDGIYQSGNELGLQLDNVERVEVVKGPQSALYGRSTFGGAINYISKKPSNEFEGQAKLTFAEDDQYDQSLSVSGPIIKDKLLYRLGLSHHEFGGQYKETSSGDVIGGERTDSFMGTLLWNVSDTLDATWNFATQQDDDEISPMLLNPATANNCRFTGYRDTVAAFGPQAGQVTNSAYNKYLTGGATSVTSSYCGDIPGADEVSADLGPLRDEAGVERESTRTDLTINWEFMPGYTLTSLSGYNSTNKTDGFDQDYIASSGPSTGFGNPAAPRNLYVSSIGFQDQETISQEFRVTSPGDQQYRWLAGIYYYHDNIGAKSRLNPVSKDRLTATSQPQGEKFDNGYSDKEGRAVYGQISYDWTSQLTTSAELRYGKDDIENQFRGRNTECGLPSSTSPAVFCYQTRKTSDDNVTWRLTADYELSEESMLYGVISTGYKLPGFNSPYAVAGIEAIEEYQGDELTSYEVGVKTDWLENTVQANVGYFFQNWEEQQLSAGIQTAAGNVTTAIQNVGKTYIQGIETDVKWVPTENWTLGVAYAYTDAEVQEGEDRSATWLSIRPDPDLEGYTPPLVSEHQASANIGYSNALFNTGMDWFARADYTYRSERYVRLQNDSEIGDSAKVNLRVGVENEALTVAFWAKNLTDEDTPDSGLAYVDPAYGSSATSMSNGGLGNRSTVSLLPRKRQLGIDIAYRF